MNKCVANIVGYVLIVTLSTYTLILTIGKFSNDSTGASSSFSRSINKNELMSFYQQQQEHQGNQSSGLKCISLETEMEELLNSTQQLFIGMPAKAAGTTFGTFVAKYCMKDYNLPKATHNFLTRKEVIEYTAKNNYDFPPVLSSHMLRKESLLRLVKEATDETLLIYLHRPETERLLSSIKNVAWKYCIKKYPASLIDEDINAKIHYSKSDNNCVVEESALFDLIKTHEKEIGDNLQSAMDCSFFDEFQNHRPKMVIAHFTKTDNLLKAIAKRHCPDVLDQLHLLVPNRASEKGLDIFVKLESSASTLAPISDWVVKKKHVFQILYDWFEEYDCHGKIREIEERMLNTHTCNDEIVQMVARKEFFQA
jgi:hypothetical protein